MDQEPHREGVAGRGLARPRPGDPGIRPEPPGAASFVDPYLIFDSWDRTPKGQVLPLVLDLLYSGRTMEAWEALAHYYRYPDLDAFPAEIEARVSQSPWYHAP